MLGGSLYQDIPAQFLKEINHAEEPPYDVAVHRVKLIPQSPLGKLLKKEHVEVNSSHHQGINRIAEELEVMAFADDGLVEAVCMPAHPFLWAVQWHPELLPKDETSKKLFTSFVRSAETNRFMKNTRRELK
jgi:putative glutamine amidotransferase